MVSSSRKEFILIEEGDSYRFESPNGMTVSFTSEQNARHHHKEIYNTLHWVLSALEEAKNHDGVKEVVDKIMETIYG